MDTNPASGNSAGPTAPARGPFLRSGQPLRAPLSSLLADRMPVSAAPRRRRCVHRRSGSDIETAFPQLVAARSLVDAEDIASVLRHRVERWTQAAGGRRQARANVVAGLIPRAQGVTDPDLAAALTERDRAMEDRARTLADQAVEARHDWASRLPIRPNGSGGCGRSPLSPPTGTAGTSPAATSSAPTSRRVSSRRLNVSGRRPQHNGPTPSIRA